MNYILLQASAGGSYQSLIMMGAIALVFYFFMIRPQQKKQKDLKNFREALKKGAEVVTTGGIHGKIVSVSDQKITLQVDVSTKLIVTKDSISNQVSEKKD